MYECMCVSLDEMRNLMIAMSNGNMVCLGLGVRSVSFKRKK